MQRKKNVSTTPSEMETAIMARLPFESRYGFMMELNEATRTTLDKLYIQERKKLEREAGNPHIVVKAPREEFTASENDSIKANERDAFSALVPFSGYTHEPSAAHKLKILKNGYHPQWFLMRPQDMTVEVKTLFSRLLKAFPSFRSVYAAKESLRSDYFECEDADVLAELAELLLPDEPAYASMHGFIHGLWNS